MKAEFDGLCLKWSSGLTWIFLAPKLAGYSNEYIQQTVRHELAHAFSVEHLERIFGQDATLNVVGQKAARVVAAQAKGRLRQIVCAE